MKVIFITREDRHLSGARVRCYDFAGELKKYGLDTEVFSFADHLGAKCGEIEGQMSAFEKLKLNVRALALLLKKEKDSIFVIQRLNYHTLAPFLASAIKKNKIIFDCDDWNIREDPRYYLGFYPSSKMEFLTRRFARYATVCITASHFLEDFLRPFAKKAYYLPTGVDTEFFKPQTKTSSRSERSERGNIVFGWLGTVYHEHIYANIRFLVDSFTALAGRHSNIVLAMAGEGKYFAKARSELKGHPYAERIRIDEWLHHDKVPAYLNTFDVGLLPLIQDTKFNQAKSPTKLFEYMACSKPTVSSRVGEARYIVRDGINGFLAGSQREFIEKMEALIEDESLCRRLGREARQDAEKKYSLALLGEQLYGILKETSLSS